MRELRWGMTVRTLAFVVILALCLGGCTFLNLLGGVDDCQGSCRVS